MDILVDKATELFWDFSAVREELMVSTIPHLPEPVIRIGVKCSWFVAWNLRPPGAPVFLGAQSGEVWWGGEVERDGAFLNSSVAHLEECLIAHAAFYRSSTEHRVAFRDLVGRLLDVEPRLVEPAPGFWHAVLVGLAIDLNYDEWVPPWRPPVAK